VILPGFTHFGYKWADGSALIEPAGERGVFVVGQAGHGQRHALVGVVAGVVGEVGVADTLVGAGETQFEVFGQFAVGRKFILFAKADHVFEEATGLVAPGEYGVKTHFTPLLLGLGVDSQARGFLGFQASAIVNGVFVCAAPV